MSETKDILLAVRDGRMSVEEAEVIFKTAPFADIGYAKVDMHRKIRQGAGEVIYGAGKTAEQIAGIIRAMTENGQDRILITRIDQKKEEAVRRIMGSDLPEKWRYESLPQAAICGDMPEPDGIGTILVATGGTSDLPVAEEAALTAEFHGNRVNRVYDIGVSGLHRLLPHLEEIASASVIIAIAGMEGALASVVGGLASCPVIAVPTSVGYGASFGGIAALLSMLNSCASGVSVVNIDNGFGAGFLAGRINHMG
ncbi:MAG: nickel pincer cofactor biosynthesis protein LarB [Lachnospiraceae bacterium]|nr:nickel pincer cofactor biosynthesis protein LarB [Lachnospiraceae bacterium]